ncbi:MAG: magnesium chelatase [Planctomycetes bacterium]|nr:magnesium chelatase [Planctomycetota bacterium]
MRRARTLGELKASGWRSRSVRDELRENLIAGLREGRDLWPGILGYGKTVLPQIENAILSRHDFILLGLRGQAKTRLLRMLVNLLDPWLPALEGCELNDDPLAPISARGRRLVEERQDDAPVAWIPREERYREKLATPDVTIADLLGDIDPIKAASRKLSLADEDVLHFGIIPRTNRGIFAINELPDLSPRIQVGLLNILEERDVQLRGFPVRFPLDVLLVFSANPEDYTHRGAIITPLRDRIASQVMTHYPPTPEISRAITDQEAWTRRDGVEIRVPEIVREAIEEVAIQARRSELVDQASGVSVRLSIALLENVLSNAERRAHRLGQRRAVARIADLFAAESAVTGKIELVFEGEREGPAAVADRILGDGVLAVFLRRFPAPYRASKRKQAAVEEDAYKPIVDWFAKGNRVSVQDEDAGLDGLTKIPGLADLARKHVHAEDLEAGCELVLEGLHRSSLLAKEKGDGQASYGDMLKRMFEGFSEP